MENDTNYVANYSISLAKVYFLLSIVSLCINVTKNPGSVKFCCQLHYIITKKKKKDL